MEIIRRAIGSVWNLVTNNQLLSSLIILSLTGSGLGSIYLFDFRFSLSKEEVQIACQLLTGNPESYGENCFSDIQILNDYARDHQAAVSIYENRPPGDYVYIVASRYKMESCDGGINDCFHFLGRRGKSDFIAAIIPDTQQFDVIQNRNRKPPLIAVGSDTISGEYSTGGNYWFIRVVNASLLSPLQ